MDHLAILTIIGGFLVFGLASGRIQDSVLTGPMLFAAFGLIVGPAALGLVPMQIDNTVLHWLAEITLILVLFADASSIDLHRLMRDHNLPLRMLAIGMPVNIALGALAALALFTELTIWEAALLAAILAPTDAALGQAVVTHPAVPARIRQALNVESGLNDGIALPLVLIFAALASASQETKQATEWLLFGLTQVTLGPVAGVAVGYLGAKLVALCNRTGWMTERAEGMVALALAFGAFGVGEAIHGNGFIAAFIAGLTFSNALGRACRYLFEFAESEGQILVLLTFFAFGCVMIPMTFPNIGLSACLYALLAVTVLRMLPVSLSLLGTRIKPVTSVFLGWFGPRGLASVLFVLLILEEMGVPHKDTIFTVAITTVVLSIVLHGVTAGWAARSYGAWCASIEECEEKRPVSEKAFEGA
ncbi:MAG TPA: cation:proton antiporter [Gammaproteobacteria bacterium]|nr:cation:proton antiporter [Gammaproteobacteria bacterium]